MAHTKFQDMYILNCLPFSLPPIFLDICKILDAKLMQYLTLS